MSTNSTRRLWLIRVYANDGKNTQSGIFFKYDKTIQETLTTTDDKRIVNKGQAGLCDDMISD